MQTRTLDMERALGLLSDMPALLDAATPAQLRTLVQQVMKVVWLDQEGITAFTPGEHYADLVEVVATYAGATDGHVGGATSTGLEPATFSSGG